MRFCQVDGTPLVEDVPFDPYATMVARPEDLMPPAVEAPAEPAVETQPEEAPPIAEPEDVLDLPEADPLKTMYVSDAEMKEVLGDDAAEAEIVEIPPIGSSPEPAEDPIVPEQPSFSVPDVPAPSFGDVAPPPSPFSSPEPLQDEPSLNEAETMYQMPYADPPSSTPFEPAASTPFEPPAPAPVAEWTPPPAPDASWQNREIGSNTPFQPPVGAGGENKTLAIISLVCGILSLVCCSWFIPGIAAIVLGVVARNKAKSSPGEYGGEGLAMGGIITGGISVLLGILVIILYMMGALAGVIGNLT